MKKTKFTLSLIITLIGALGFGGISFFGYMYLKSGDFISSILYPLLFTISLILCAFLAANFKKARFNFQKNAYKELLFVVLYVFIAIISIVGFTHFFTVQDRKEEIAKKIEGNISNVEFMFVQYESKVDNRMIGFDGFLNATIAGKNLNRPQYEKYFVVGGPDETFQKNSKLTMFKDDIKPAEYDTMKFLALDWLKKSKQTILDIKPIGIMEVINNFEKNTNEWYEKIKVYDAKINTFTDEVKQEPFSYHLDFTSVNDELTKQNKPGVLAILFLIVAHTLILFVYLLAIRDGKSPGFWRSLYSKQNTSKGDL